MPDVSQPSNLDHSTANNISTGNRPITNRSTPKPFVIEVRQDRPKQSGSFIPAASLKINEEFRTSGLLAFLPPEDLKNLLYLLTFVTPEGHCQVSLPILTSAMKVPTAKVKARMHRLAQTKWQGESIVVEVPHESGLFTYSLHPHLVAYEHLTVSEPFPTSPFPSPALPITGSRQQVIAYSRGHYATPRAEVERLVAGQMGHEIEETPEQRKLRIRLENAGLTGEQAREVVRTYPVDVIAQQLDWLPYRNAKNPAGYLLAAIEGGYQEPRAVREERLFRELRYEEQMDKGQLDKGQTPELDSESASVVDGRAETGNPEEAITAIDTAFQEDISPIATSSTGTSPSQAVDIPVTEGEEINLTPNQ